MKIAATVTQGIFAAIPIIALIVNAVIAGVLLATINFGFAGKATFWEVFAVSWYAGLPGLIKVILGIASLLAGLAPESFNSQNFSGTNIGYYLPPDSPKALLSLATLFDVITLWSSGAVGNRSSHCGENQAQLWLDRRFRLVDSACPHWRRLAGCLLLNGAKIKTTAGRTSLVSTAVVFDLSKLAWLFRPAPR